MSVEHPRLQDLPSGSSKGPSCASWLWQTLALPPLRAYNGLWEGIAMGIGITHRYSQIAKFGWSLSALSIIIVNAWYQYVSEHKLSRANNLVLDVVQSVAIVLSFVGANLDEGLIRAMMKEMAAWNYEMSESLNEQLTMPAPSKSHIKEVVAVLLACVSFVVSLYGTIRNINFLPLLASILTLYQRWLRENYLRSKRSQLECERVRLSLEQAVFVLKNRVIDAYSHIAELQRRKRQESPAKSFRRSVELDESSAGSPHSVDVSTRATPLEVSRDSPVRRPSVPVRTIAGTRMMRQQNIERRRSSAAVDLHTLQSQQVDRFRVYSKHFGALPVFSINNIDSLAEAVDQLNDAVLDAEEYRSDEEDVYSCSDLDRSFVDNGSPQISVDSRITDREFDALRPLAVSDELGTVLYSPSPNTATKSLILSPPNSAKKRSLRRARTLQDIVENDDLDSF